MSEIIERFDIGASDGTTRPVLREMAIRAFGSTYVHAGDWTRPIHEVIGRQGPGTMPSFTGRFFPSAHDATEYVSRMAREAVADDAEIARSFLSSWSTRIFVASSHVLPARRMGAARAMVEAARGRLSRAERVLSSDYSPTVVRLPSELRFPSIVSMDSPVYVVDCRRFLSSGVRVREERIVERRVVPTQGGEFDAVVRYRVSNVSGLVRYDHVGQTEDKLSKISDGVYVFLWRDAADAFARSFASALVRAADKTVAQIEGPAGGGAVALIETDAAA